MKFFFQKHGLVFEQSRSEDAALLFYLIKSRRTGGFDSEKKFQLIITIPIGQVSKHQNIWIETFETFETSKYSYFYESVMHCWNVCHCTLIFMKMYDIFQEQLFAIMSLFLFTVQGSLLLCHVLCLVWRTGIFFSKYFYSLTISFRYDVFFGLFSEICLKLM